MTRATRRLHAATALVCVLLAGTPLAFAPLAGHAQSPPSDGTPDAGRLEVHLLTIDQGDAVWEKFGHNALLIRDRSTGRAIAWNWGLFDFYAEDFIPRFLKGSMLYTMGPVDPEALLASYEAANRTVYSNRVNLTDAEAEALERLVWTNFEPENRDYTYHYFLDNCSTRVRDALDRVLGGVLRETFGNRETTRSFRWHSRRLVQGTTWIDQGLSFLLGTRGDAPRSEWEAMFVPMELMRLLEEVERTNRDGASIPLLGPREVLFQATREPTPAGPPSFSLIWPLLGLGGGIGLAFLGLRASKGSRLARGSLAVGAAGWGAFSACFGGLLVGAWFTDHDFIHWNLNLLYVSPAGILLAPAALGTFLPEERGGRQARSVLVGLAGAIAILAVLAVLGEATLFLHQGNGEVVAVALPINVMLAWATATAFSGVGGSGAVPGGARPGVR